MRERPRLDCFDVHARGMFWFTFPYFGLKRDRERDRKKECEI